MKKVMIGVIAMFAFQLCTIELSEIDGVIGEHIDALDQGGLDLSSVPSNSFLVTYFEGNDFENSISKRIENRIKHDFNSPVSNDFNSDQLSAKWTGNFNFDAGKYKFSVHSDKGINLLIDSEFILQNSNKGEKNLDVNYFLDGVHNITVTYNIPEYSATDTVANEGTGGSGSTGNSVITDPVVELDNGSPTVEVLWIQEKETSNVNFSLTGLHFSEEEINLWRERAKNGPYKTKGDFVTNSPGEWERLLKFTKNFRENPRKDLWDGFSGQEPHKNHHELLSAAFISLVNEDVTLANLVKQELLKQISVVKVSDLTYINKQKGFHTANWCLRLLYSYDYTKAVFNDNEKSLINKWFSNAGYFFANNVHNNLKSYFPNRLLEDYSVRKDAAKNGGFKEGLYAFVDESGKNQNKIYWIHTQFNNRVASKIRFAAMVGIFLNDSKLIHQGKIYVKEHLMFSTFPDGTMGEYERNGDYNSPQTGAMYYGAINIEVAMNLAETLARKGDFELYEFTTSKGIYGTEGGEKNILLLMRAYTENMIGSVKRYYKSVNVLNLIDFNDESQERKNIAFDIMFAQSNWYYKDSFIESCYLRKNPKSKEYSGNGYWHNVQVYWPWSGVTATIPSYPFMFAAY